MTITHRYICIRNTGMKTICRPKLRPQVCVLWSAGDTEQTVQALGCLRRDIQLSRNAIHSWSTDFQKSRSSHACISIFFETARQHGSTSRRRLCETAAVAWQGGMRVRPEEWLQLNIGPPALEHFSTFCNPSEVLRCCDAVFPDTSLSTSSKMDS